MSATPESPEWDTPAPTKPTPQVEIRTRSRFLGIPTLLIGIAIIVVPIAGLFDAPLSESFPVWLGLLFLLFPLAIGFWIAVTGLQLLRTPTFGSLKSNLAILSFSVAFIIMARLVGPWSSPSLFAIALAAAAVYLGMVRLLGKRLIAGPAPRIGAWMSRGMVALISVFLWIDLSSALMEFEMRTDDPGISILSDFFIGLLAPILVAVGFFQVSIRLLGLKSRHRS